MGDNDEGDVELARKVLHQLEYLRLNGDVESGRWRINPAAAEGLGLAPDNAQEHLRYYTRALEEGGKYNLTIWPFHALRGGVGHALVSGMPRPPSAETMSESV